MIRDEELLFAEEPSIKAAKVGKPWKIVIADDDEEVHAVTRMVLDGFSFRRTGFGIIRSLLRSRNQTSAHRTP